uniref:Fanconi anemia group M protein isoform X3 n=1 Tax=Jaculus jaculus TaxID=51337 RepID=UPI001E1B482D|nr:Fanconi anemia group M protein isoform X3 [Jaculus jaculus]
MSGRQRTLFQAWGSSLSRGTGAPGCPSAGARPRGPDDSQARTPAAEEDRDSDDDDVLLVAVCEAERQLRQEDGGFCRAAGALWIYPTNFPVREYQLSISYAALLRNTLVCLPTGLGKTFIAAVVMYNFYRWFPSGKVVFMAPTKPLVTQQMEACYRVMGIPQSHMAEMTGSTQAATRKEMWCCKRVLFLTPQVMVNDLTRGVCPAADIKCLVVDEAHKALGNYAYCQTVQQVITNLLIGQIELRSEDSPDILPYSHERRVEKHVVPLGEELAAIQKTYIQILEAFASSLIQRNILMRRDIPTLTKYQLILARDQFRKNPSPNIAGIQQGIIEGEFAICISLYHGYELLQQMGMRSLYFFLSGIMGGTKGMTRAKTELSRNEDFLKLYNHLESIFAQTRNTLASGGSAVQKGDKENQFYYSHPKLKKLEEVVVGHFKSWNAKNSSEKKCLETRVMIFSSFRDSVQEIAEMLLQHQPIIRVMTFIGHASGKSTKGFTQKEQLEVVKRFRDGGYNTLVSTCVGEEGLDIGEVDLIICFDAQKSPIRLIQRMGRTGRKRQGRIVVILAEGREERTYNQSQSNKRNIYKAISGNRQVLHFYQGSPRMVPENIHPKLHKMVITHGVREPEKPSQKLQRKSSLFSSIDGTRQNSSNKNGFLSEEEFSLWNRLYRLRDSDKIKEITLPPVHFPSLEDEESRTTQEPTMGAHQLSLSEWRLWQDHPFPTHQVDHSDRCHQFVNIMQVIEGMRHEEDECSYELELKPYLKMEDVISTFSAPQNEYCNLSNDPSITHKKSSFMQDINRGSLFSVIKSDEECDENFKQTHPKLTKIISLKRKASKEMRKDQLNKEINDDVDSLDTDRNSVEAGLQADLSHEGRASNTGVGATTCATNDNASNCPDMMLTECPVTDKLGLFAGNSVDSGYNSFSDEKSISLNLFLEFEELCIAQTNEQFSNCPSLTKEVLANVERFLSHSPPPLGALSDLECEITTKGLGLENLHCLPYTEQVQNYKPTCLLSHSTMISQQNLDLGSFRHNNHPFEKSCHSDTANEKISDESCFGDKSGAEVANNSRYKHLVSNSSAQIYIDPAKNLAENKTHEGNNDLPVLHTDQDGSLLLFEDDNEISDVSLSPFNGNCKSWFMSHKILESEEAPVSQFLISDELLSNVNSEPEEQVISDFNHSKSCEGLEDGHEKLKSNDYAFDSSRDLFSVTFDLGFCSSDSDDESMGHANTNTSKQVGDLSGRHSDIKQIKGARSISRDCVEQFISGAMPFSSQEDKHCTHHSRFPPRAADSQVLELPQFSLAVKEKVMCTPQSASHTLNLCSKIREEMVKTPDSNRETLNSTFDDLEFSLKKAKSSDQVCLHQSHRSTEDEHIFSNESEDEIFLRKTKKPRGNVLKSPEDQKNSEVDSPIKVVKKSRVLRSELSSSDESEKFHGPCLKLEDFKDYNRKARRGFRAQRRQSYLQHIARKFLDNEAELSEEDAECISSDENESENEQDSSLLEFLNDKTELSQAVNDSEMKAIYMKSLHSPLMSNKYKMVHRNHNNVNIFSQIPVQDQTYLEDSFCVDDEEESFKSQSSEEDLFVDFNLTEDCFPNDSVRYKTRHAVKLKQMKTKQNCRHSKKKLSRIMLPDDDSSEEEDTINERREASAKVSPNTVDKDQHLNFVPAGYSLQPMALSNPVVSRPPQQRPETALDFTDAVMVLNFKPLVHNESKSTSPLCPSVSSQEEHGKHPVQLKVDSDQEVSSGSGPHCSKLCLANKLSASRLPQDERKPCILVDSHEITSGLEVISSLRSTHGFHVEVCPLNVCDYIVSNRMVVERRSRSDMQNTVNKSKFVEQIQCLKSMFERICVIVEKDREKPGDTSRIFRRTKSYDSLLISLIGAGIRILFSSCQEETADLLKELCLVEQRKNAGIHIPVLLNSKHCEALPFYLSIPNISYITALNMGHQFPSVKKMANSSPEEISMYAQVTHQKAEEICRYIHYVFDIQMLPSDLNQERLKSDA